MLLGRLENSEQSDQLTCLTRVAARVGDPIFLSEFVDVGGLKLVVEMLQAGAS